MAKKLFALFALVLTFSLSIVFAQEAPTKAAKPARWEGIVVRISCASRHPQPVRHDKCPHPGRN